SWSSRRASSVRAQRGARSDVVARVPFALDEALGVEVPREHVALARVAVHAGGNPVARPVSTLARDRDEMVDLPGAAGPHLPVVDERERLPAIEALAVRQVVDVVQVVVRVSQSSVIVLRTVYETRARTVARGWLSRRVGHV